MTVCETVDRPAPIEAEAPQKVSSQEEFTKILEGCMETFGGWVHDESFEKLGEKNGVLMHKKEPADGLPIIRGVYNFGNEFTALEIIKYIWDGDNKIDYDDKYQTGGVVETYFEDDDESLRLDYQVFKNVFGVAGRDFLHCGKYQKLGEEHYRIVVQSVTHPEYPEECFVKGKVRGELSCGGYDIKADEAGDMIITYAFQMDLCGSIPRWIVNKLNQQQPQHLVAMKKAMIRKRGA